MTTNTKKHKVHDTVSYPHIGRFLKQYFYKNGINKASLSRQIGVAESTSSRYLQQESLQFGILWKISIALKRNLIGDLALLLPVAFVSPREKELETQMQTLQQENLDLKKEIEIYKGIVSKDG